MRLRHPLRSHALALGLAAGAAVSGFNAKAALVARDLDGNTGTAEAYYDTVLGVSWMRDLGRLHTAYGLAQAMDYASVNTALAAFNADTALNFGYSGWRLPRADGVHLIGGAGCQFGVNGSSDCGENVNTSSSELASMFHDTLGNLSWRDTSGAARPGAQGADWGLVNSGDFLDLDPIGYWTGTQSYRLVFGTPQHGQVAFDMRTGSQSIATPGSARAAWLVHDGVIGNAVSSSAVPLPGSLGLAALGLVLLARHRRA